MKLSLKSALKISVFSALSIAPVLLLGSSAFAKPAMNDIYVGAGITQSVTDGGNPGQESRFGGNISGRIPIASTPISVRGSVLFDDRTSTIVPTVTYDMGIAKNTNLFVGGGASFVQDKGTTTALGDRNAPVITLGVESKVLNNIVLYGDTKVAIDAYENSSNPAVAFSVGAGFSF